MSEIRRVTTAELEAQVAETLARYPHFADVEADCAGCAVGAATGYRTPQEVVAWDTYSEACFLLERPAYVETEADQ